jgi:SAM-dependent methyltransferase
MQTFSHFIKIAVLLPCTFLTACALPDRGEGTTTANPARASAAVKKLRAEAQSLAPMARSALAKDFLSATASLPNVTSRTIYVDSAHKYYARAEIAALPESKHAAFKPVVLDEYRYYYTKYGSPLAYVRAIDLLSQQGVQSFADKRILDFGYGSVGHLRLMASLGADVVGVDVDSYLAALYSEAGDMGRVAGRRGAPSGSIRLLNGNYPADRDIVAKVGSGFDLIVSKNTLKRGYIKPARPTEQRLLINLGVNDEVFLKTLAAALKPGGILMIYNIAPAPAPANKPYIPWADARSPFTRKQYEAAGFSVIAFDANDDQPARDMGRALGWDKNDKGEKQANFDKDIFALYTILVKTGG